MILGTWDGQGIPEKKYRVRWATECRNVVSGWLGSNYPSFKEVKNHIIDKKVIIELENIKTGERYQTNSIPVTSIDAIKYMDFVTEDGSFTAAIGILDEEKTTFVFCNGKQRIEKRLENE